MRLEWKQYFVFLFILFFVPRSLDSLTILITGGAGYVGSHVNKLLLEEGHHTIILDNLVNGDLRSVLGGEFIRGDVGDSYLLDQIFQQNHVDAVMHLAAFLEVGESVSHPLKYYTNNVMETISLLNSMYRNGVKKIIFSSSCTIFGHEDSKLVREDHECNPISPYGRSKLMVETILQDLSNAYDFRYCSLRYFNAAGADPEGKLKNYKRKHSMLIPIILNNIVEKKNKISIFGADYDTKDGTCIRDYIHVLDIAKAHLLALNYLIQGGGSQTYNLGNSKGYSVLDVIETVEKITGVGILRENKSRRIGDPAILVADFSKIRKDLGWSPIYPDLHTMIEHSWAAASLISNS